MKMTNLPSLMLSPSVVPLFGPDKTDFLVSHDAFFAIVNMTQFAGDALSRKYAALFPLQANRSVLKSLNK